MLRCILSSLFTFAIFLGAIVFAPSSFAEEGLPSGSYVEGYEIKNLSVIKDAFDDAGGFEISQTFANCGYFAWVTHDITVTDTMGNQGSFDYDDFVVVCLFCPENASHQAEIGNYQGNQYFGIPEPNTANPSSPPRWRVVIGKIKGSGSSQYIEYSSPLETFNFDNSWDFPLNSADKPPLYYNFPSLRLGIPSDFGGKGEIISYGSVDSLSNANLLAGLYDITFTPTVSFPADFPLIGKSLKVAPVAVRDDTGYNLISLQVPQLGAYADVIVFGEYHFVPCKSSSETYFNGLKFSFGSDPLNENDDDYDGSITPSMFSCVVDGHPLKSKSMTVNSLSFFYNTKLQKYSNREFTIFDFSSSDSNIYPSVRFMGIGSINGMSAGSVCYNCDFSGLVSSDNSQTIADEGRKKTEDTVDELGYVPVDLTYPDPSEGFTFDDPKTPDFSALGNIFSFMFNNRIIRAMLEMCLVVGLAGYVMYGKKGD